MRTVKKFIRVYANGYDISGHTSDIGPLIQTYDITSVAGLSWEVKGALLGQPTLGIGTLNGIYDNTATTGLQAVMGSSGNAKKIMIAIGMSAVPAAGDPCYVGEFNQLAFTVEPGENMATATIPFGNNKPAGINYESPWGKLLHAKASETGANTGTGVDFLGAGTNGGYLMYQIFSITGTGTVTISIDESSDNGSSDAFAALTGATSGAIATASAPTSGIIQLAKTAAIEQYLRWQIAFGGSASACEFALVFVKG